jgi:hypothetical protein
VKKFILALGIAWLALIGAAHAATCTIGGTSFTCFANSDGNFSLAANPAQPITTGTAWTSSTSINATQTVIAALGSPAVLVQLQETTTITGGAVTFQCSYDGTNWITLPEVQLINTASGGIQSNPYTFVASTNRPFTVLMGGCQSVRLNLTTVITGTGSVTPLFTALNYQPITAISSGGCGNFPAGGVGVAAISITGNTQILNGVSGQQIYICSLNLMSSAADSVSVVEGTGSTCGTSTAAVFGGTTAAAGWAMGPNGPPIQLGSGRSPVARTVSVGDNLCIFVSSGATLAGSISYLQF